MPTDTLPLFPLRLVLFPGVPQLLHVFEQRYRELLADCLAGDRRFGLTLVRSGQTTVGPGDTGCTALIKADTRLPDGRSNIITEGEDRFVIESLEPSPHAYLIGRVQYFGDEPAEPGDRDRAAEVWTQLQKFRAMLTSDPSGETLPNDPSLASFRIAAHLNLSIEVQDELLRLTSVSARLERLDELIRTSREDAARAMEAANLHRGNGKGEYHPDLNPYE